MVYCHTAQLPLRPRSARKWRKAPSVQRFWFWSQKEVPMLAPLSRVYPERVELARRSPLLMVVPALNRCQPSGHRWRGFCLELRGTHQARCN